MNIFKTASHLPASKVDSKPSTSDTTANGSLESSNAKLEMSQDGKSTAGNVTDSLSDHVSSLCPMPYYLTTSYETKPLASKPTLSNQLTNLSLSSRSTSRKVEKKSNEAHTKRQAFDEIDESGGWKGETYEKQKIQGVNEAFLAFQDRVGWCGQSNQVIR